MKKNLWMVALAFLSALGFASAQGLSGKVTDAKDGSPLPGVSISVKGSGKGSVTNASGEYSINLASGSYTVTFSSVGFTSTTQTVQVSGNTTLNASLTASSTALSDVVVVGSRASQRTRTDTPLPVDVLTNRDLMTTGQPTFDKSLMYRIPSFNTVNTPVNDATTLLDPYEIRNLGPSRTLILVNGKRKNLSSLLYVQFSPGRGETGVDLSAIPQDAIKRVEILRDGASAQYGSDAIAGVMNVVLKDRYDYTSLNLNLGTTHKGDGTNYGLSFNGGSNYGEKGFLNYTVAIGHQGQAVRSGIIDVPTEIATFGGNPLTDDLIRRYLKDRPTGGNINGTGEISSGKFLLNAGIPVGETGQFYGNAALVVKKVISQANFRTPYWRVDRGLLHAPTDNGGINYFGSQAVFNATFGFKDDFRLYNGYVGYVPTFEGDLTDYNGTIGYKDVTNGWQTDASLTVGGNQQLYTVNNTVNRSFGASSPTSFRPGGYSFSHIVGNFDMSKSLNDQVSVAFGTEMRSEKFQIFAGDTASYKGEGSNSFPGIAADNATTNRRFNLGAYADISYDITKDFLINGTLRAEKYSDFGNATVFKLSTRYKFSEDKVTLRGSYSTGFRAPTLHQIYAQSTQAAFQGGTIKLSGLFNNFSAQAGALGIKRLTPERSTNLAFGLGLKPNNNLSITLDYYNIDIKDRVVYSSSISSGDASSVLGQILARANVSSVQFFINGINTNTQGLDYVLNYKNVAVGRGKMAFNLAGNYTFKNEIVGSPNEPAAVKAGGSSILSAQIRSLLTESRPLYKTVFGADYMVGKFSINLNNTLFGPTKFQDLDNGGSDMNNIKQVFKPAVVTDINFGYNFSDRVSGSFTINNILNILPQWDLEALNPAGQAVLNNAESKNLLKGFLSFSGRYGILGYNGSQFSQLGTTVNATLNIRL